MLKIQNLQAKTQVRVLKKDLDHREKLIDELLTTGNLSSTGVSKDSQLIFKLKALVRDLQDQLKLSDKENEHLKKNIKLTRHEETTQELEAMTAECLRLRKMLEESEQNAKRVQIAYQKMKASRRGRRQS